MEPAWKLIETGICVEKAVEKENRVKSTVDYRKGIRL